MGGHGRRRRRGPARGSGDGRRRMVAGPHRLVLARARRVAGRQMELEKAAAGRRMGLEMAGQVTRNTYTIHVEYTFKLVNTSLIH